ncbi:MAG TPA: hypothetical protein DIT43_02830 [Dehalococcoidia bacterium]|nr:hypothetical protein [Dehalococcoidia bacterium]
MSEMKILDKAKLVEFIEKLGADFEVIVPRHEDGNLVFGSLDHTPPVVEFTGKPLVPPKEYLFPQREELLTFTVKGKEIRVEAHPDKVKRVIWGIRPCDLAGIKTLDTIFLSNYIDNYYQARRENTILMGLNCNEPCSSGFCSPLGTGPFAKDSFDLLFTDLGNRFLIETGSEAGRELVASSADLFAEARDADKAELRKLEEKCKRAFESPLPSTVDLATVSNKLSGAWGDALWTEESETCILCGGCNFICPTCHCFNIEDIPAEQQGVSTRVRYWDSCQLGGFTQMAAENTRRTQAERLRQRVFHKLVYIPDKYNGAVGCTGCGRCIEVCPGEISITNILGRVMRK